MRFGFLFSFLRVGFDFRMELETVSNFYLFFFLSDAFKMILENQRENDVDL